MGLNRHGEGASQPYTVTVPAQIQKKCFQASLNKLNLYMITGQIEIRIMITKTVVGLFFLCIISISFVNPSPAIAQNDGNNLIVSCNEAIKVIDKNFTEGDGVAAVECLSLIQGVRATSTIYSSVLNDVGLKDNYSRICIPQNIPLGQLARVAVKYLNENPENLHIEGPALIWLGLLDAYACNKN